MFADLRAVSRPRPERHEPESELAPEPAGAPARVAALARRRGRGAARAVHRRRCAARSPTTGSTSLERTPGAGGGVLPAVPLPAACRDRRARRSSRSSTAGSRMPTSSSGTSARSFREVLDRLGDGARGARPGRRRPGPRGPFPLLRRAGDRRGARAGVRRDGAAPRGARRPSPSAPDARELIDARSSTARARSAPLTDRLPWARPPRPLAGCWSRRWLAATTARASLGGFEHAELDGHRRGAGGATCSRAPPGSWPAAYVELDEVTAIAAAFTRHAATLPGGDRSRCSTCTSRAPTSKLPRAEVDRGSTARRVGGRFRHPRRFTGSSSRSPSPPGPGDVGHRPVHVPARTRAALVEDEVLRGLHPMMGHRLRLWRLREFDLERLRLTRGHLHVPRRRARERRRTSGCLRWPRSATSPPSTTNGAACVALPELERVLVSGAARRSAASRRAGQLHRRLMWNRVLLHAWPVIELHPGRDPRAGRAPRAPRRPDSGIELVRDPGPAARAGRHRPRAGAAVLRRRPDTTSRSRSTTRRPSRCSRSTRARGA